MGPSAHDARRELGRLEKAKVGIKAGEMVVFLLIVRADLEFKIKDKLNRNDR